MKKIILISTSIILFSCGGGITEIKKASNDTKHTIDSLPLLNYEVTAVFPHDTLSYTEGLVIHNGKLFESTGSPDYLKQTRSVFGDVDLKTGKISIKAELDRSKYFGEGIVFFGEKLYQLTYKNKTGFIYDAVTFKKEGEFTYTNEEGWGLTTDGKNIIMSDGSSVLTFLDPASLKPIKTVTVNTIDMDMPDYLNELEYIDGFVYANLWKTNDIIKIDPANGQIKGLLHLDALYTQERKKYVNAEFMNGIAFDKNSGKIYITGKLWPSIYQIQLK